MSSLCTRYNEQPLLDNLKLIAWDLRSINLFIYLHLDLEIKKSGLSMTAELKNKGK